MWVLGTKPEFLGGVAGALKHPKSSWLHYFFTFAILGSDAGPHVVGKLSPPELQPQGALYFYFQCLCVCSVKEFNGFFFSWTYFVNCRDKTKQSKISLGIFYMDNYVSHV